MAIVKQIRGKWKKRAKYKEPKKEKYEKSLNVQM